MAAFQVITIGRFWVITEDSSSGQREMHGIRRDQGSFQNRSKKSCTSGKTLIRAIQSSIFLRSGSKPSNPEISVKRNYFLNCAAAYDKFCEHISRKLMDMGVPKHGADEHVRKIVDAALRSQKPELLTGSDGE